jgi:FMN phosphatase YigB (HAD superfamily)
VKKPEPASYERTLQRLQVLAEETAFVDDDPGYVAAARELGMHGIVFQTTSQVMTDLRRLFAPSLDMDGDR